MTTKSGPNKEHGKKLDKSEWTISSDRLSHRLVGAMFGDYVITSHIKWRRNSRTYVDVKCAHGQDRVLLDNLKRGNQVGCKLCYKERNSLPVFKTDIEKSLYYRVHSVILRCTNTKTNGYESYGGKGVSVHPDWMKEPMKMVQYLMSLPGFSLDKTIDRIDFTGNYEPGNLRWETAEGQARNRSNSIYVEYKGESIFFEDFVRKHCRLSLSQARERLKQGWTAEQLAEWEPLPRGNRVRFAKLRA